MKIKSRKKFQALDVIGQIDNNKRMRINKDDNQSSLLNIQVGSKRKPESGV